MTRPSVWLAVACELSRLLVELALGLASPWVGRLGQCDGRTKVDESFRIVGFRSGDRSLAWFVKGGK